MGKYGQIILQAVFDASKAKKELQDLLKVSASAQQTIARQSVTSNRQVASAALAAERIRTQEARTLIQANKARDASAKALLNESKAYAIVRREIEKTEAAERKKRAQEDKAGKPKMSPFARAVYSTRLNFGGASPLVGQSLSGLGLDLNKKSTLAIGAGAAAIGASAGVIKGAFGGAANVVTEFGEAAVKWLQEGTDKAGALNEAINATEVVFKSSSGVIKEWAKGAVESFGQTEKGALDAANQLGAMLQGAGLAENAAVGFTKTLVERGTDLASLFDSSIPETLDAIKSGINGEAEPLRRFGIYLSEAAVKAEAFKMHLGEVPTEAGKASAAQKRVEIATAELNQAIEKYGAGSTEAEKANLRLQKAQENLTKAQGTNHRELTEGEKIQARISLILKQSARAQGDYQRTANSAANTQRRLNAEIEQLQTRIGQDLLPLKAEFMAFFADTVDVAEDLWSALKDLGKLLADLDKSGWGQAFIDRIKGSFNALKEYLHLVNETKAKDSTTHGRTATANDDLAYFTEKRRQLDEVYKIQGLDRNDKRIVPMVKQIFDDEFYSRAKGYGVDITRRNLPGEDYAIIDNAKASANKSFTYYDALDREDRLRRSDAEINRRIQAAAAKLPVNQAPTPRSTASGTGAGASRGTTGLASRMFSGAARNSERHKQESEARKAEQVAARALREVQKQQVALYKTGVNSQVIGFGDIVEAIRMRGTVDDSVSLARARPQSALRASDEIARTEYAQLKKVTDALRAKNPQAADIALKAGDAAIQQRASSRVKQIEKAIEQMRERVLKQREREAKEAERIADQTERDRQTGQELWENFFNATEEWAAQRRQNYREFLAADADQLSYAQQQAQISGDLKRSMEIRQALYDNQTRQIGADFQEAILAAGGDPNAVAAAESRRNLALSIARREADQGIAGDILGQTPDSLRAGVQNIAGNIFRAGANGDGSFLDQLNGAFSQAGQLAGETFADYANQRFISGGLSKFFDGITAKLVAGGYEAGQGMALGANALAQVVSIITAQNSKKGGGGFLGGLLGAGLGFALGGPAGALTGFSAGAQLGQGNLMGAILSVGTAYLGGSFARPGVGSSLGSKIGAAAGKISIPSFAEGGVARARRLFEAGEVGDELAFSMGRVALLGHGYYQSSSDTTILPASTSRKLMQAAAGMGSGGDAAPGGIRITNNFHGPIHDRHDVDIVAQQNELVLRRAEKRFGG